MMPLVGFSAILQKGENFCDSLFAFWLTKSLLKRINSGRKEFAPDDQVVSLGQKDGKSTKFIQTFKPCHAE